MMRLPIVASLLAASTLAVAGCGGGSSGEGVVGAVRSAGTSVSSCVPAWSGYGGKYDDPQYANLAAARSRWRCTLETPRDWDTELTNQYEWCFSWAEGSDAEDLGFPADLTVSGEKSC
jgi:hypothetical protein